MSDFHYNLRPELTQQGIAGFFDTFVISFEHGFQKPDTRMFSTALATLDTEPEEAFMVGDRASHDGGSAAVGIDTLILPAPEAFGPEAWTWSSGSCEEVAIYMAMLYGYTA